MNNISFRKNFWRDIKKDKRKIVHLVAVATKPDLIKQAPVYHELKKRKQLVVLGHTGQHYDFNLSGGLEEEFDLKIDFNLNIKGALHKKVSQIIGRGGDIMAKMEKLGKTVIPYVHGDTTTAMAMANAGWTHRFASVHVEAGIRTLTPKKEIFIKALKNFDWNWYHKAMQLRKNWEKGSNEPFPEQFNTRCAETATGLHCAPVELDKEFLIAEGFCSDRIVVVGNTVADATRMAEKEALRKAKIFEKYPILAKGNFIRFCIHRRENTQSKKRFTILWKAIKTLVEKGETVLLISLYQTEEALQKFEFKCEADNLAKKYKNFIYSPVWPYYTDVIAAMKRAAICATDSGSMQEEMNILGVPCVTLRFGSDRSESCLAGANVIAPPINSNLIIKIILSAKNNEKMKSVKNLYGSNVSKKIVDEVLKRLDKGENMFRDEEERVGL